MAGGDVELTLRAPYDTTVTAHLRNGLVTFLEVTPADRRSDVISHLPVADDIG